MFSRPSPAALCSLLVFRRLRSRPTRSSCSRGTAHAAPWSTNVIRAAARAGLGIQRQALTAGDGAQKGEQVFFINYDSVTVNAHETTMAARASDDANDESQLDPPTPSRSARTLTVPAFGHGPLYIGTENTRPAQSVKDAITQAGEGLVRPPTTSIVVTSAAEQAAAHNGRLLGGRNRAGHHRRGPTAVRRSPGSTAANDNQKQHRLRVRPPASRRRPMNDKRPGSKPVLLVAQTIAPRGPAHTFRPRARQTHRWRTCRTSWWRPGHGRSSPASTRAGQALATTGAHAVLHGRPPTRPRTPTRACSQNLGPRTRRPGWWPSRRSPWLAPKENAVMPHMFNRGGQRFRSPCPAGGTITKVEIVAGRRPRSIRFTTPALSNNVPSGGPRSPTTHRSASRRISEPTALGGKGLGPRPTSRSAAQRDAKARSACLGRPRTAWPALVVHERHVRRRPPTPCSPPLRERARTCQTDGTCTGTSTADMAMTTMMIDGPSLRHAPAPMRRSAAPAGVCGHPRAPGMYCTQACDPNDASSCPSDYGVRRGVGTDHICGPKHHGCEKCPRSGSPAPFRGADGGWSCLRGWRVAGLWPSAAVDRHQHQHGRRWTPTRSRPLRGAVQSGRESRWATTGSTA